MREKLYFWVEANFATVIACEHFRFSFQKKSLPQCNVLVFDQKRVIVRSEDCSHIKAAVQSLKSNNNRNMTVSDIKIHSEFETLAEAA